MADLHPDIAFIRHPATIRVRCQELLQLGKENQLDHFAVKMGRLPEVVQLVLSVTRQQYPDGQIPYHSRWSHFGVGGVDRVGILRQEATRDVWELCRIFYDLVVPSILLDAGAGMGWRYKDKRSTKAFGRSEGLAVASFDMFMQGLFSSDPKQRLRADVDGLQNLSASSLASGMQVSTENPLVGLNGRCDLLHNLGHALKNKKWFDGPARGRVGALADTIAGGKKIVYASEVLAAVLDSLGGIWPGRIELHGTNLGDVWRHRKVAGHGVTTGLIPFHKLSQWLTYSLFEPLEWAGIKIEGIDELTGLAEYRNGGLFIDLGVLEPKYPEVLTSEHEPGEEVVVEWRALTIALLDEVAAQMRQKLGRSAVELPLAKVLQGGTWAAGRQVAAQKRSDGGPPLKILSDGTVF